MFKWFFKVGKEGRRMPVIQWESSLAKTLRVTALQKSFVMGLWNLEKVTGIRTEMLFVDQAHTYKALCCETVKLHFEVITTIIA